MPQSSLSLGRWQAPTRRAQYIVEVQEVLDYVGLSSRMQDPWWMSAVLNHEALGVMGVESIVENADDKASEAI